MRSIRRAIGAGALVAVAALTASCSGTELGTPVSSSAVETSTVGVPGVPAPLDASEHLDDPCGLVPSDAMSALGYTEPGMAEDGETDSTAALAGPSYYWVFPDSAKSLGLYIQTGNQKNGQGGLQGLYDAYKRGQYAYWESTTVQNYPAAYSDVSDRRDRGRCSLMVGMADDLSFSVATNSYFDRPTQACTDTKQVAEQMIETLKGGS